MEKANIGFKAGIILEKLGETGLITIAELARRLNFAADETALAAGWLARENKIYIERRNGLLYSGLYKMILPQLSIRTDPAIKWSRRVAK